jgi:hypothetical protein
MLYPPGYSWYKKLAEPRGGALTREQGSSVQEDEPPFRRNSVVAEDEEHVVPPRCGSVGVVGVWHFLLRVSCRSG